MWNLIIKFIICIYMSEFIEMIKLPLNNFVILGGLKKHYIYGKNEFLVYLRYKWILVATQLFH
jgi:hypothetical protein